MDRQRLLVDIFVAIVDRRTQAKTNRSAFMLQSVQHDAIALAKSSGTFIRRYRVTHIEEIEQITAPCLHSQPIIQRLFVFLQAVTGLL